MKMNSLKTAAAIGLTALAISSAAAQTASKPVGYETLNYGVGFTGLGVRLHQAPVTSGVIASADATSITVTGVDFGSVLTADADYVLEVENAKGIVQVVNVWAGETITTPSDLSAEVEAGVTTFTIRPVDNLVSLFGAAGSLNVVAGNGTSDGADQIWLSDGAGGYDKYYFDNFAGPNFDQTTWVKIGTGVVDGADINILYPDGIVMNSPAGGSVVVTGSVKLGPTELTLLQGFTFVSSVAPAGANLVTSFGTSGSLNVAAGNGNTDGADQIWIADGAGGYDKYYFDNFAGPNFDQESWVKIGSGFLDGSTIEIPAGFVVNSPQGGNVTAGVPSFYATL
ncbi:hypothetical protein N9889_00865 [bacterium]|nr:hypothetical protein [bacterium]MDB4266146.1 hypothetical protein [bacterium]